MRAIKRDTAASTYRAIFDYMLKYGEDFTSEDGAKCLISPGRETIIAHIKRPSCDLYKLSELSPFGRQSMEYYREQLVDGKHIKKDNPDDEAEYTYYQRLNWYDTPVEILKINQINALKDRIQRDINTRRAVATTWMPWVDIVSKDPPCMDMLKFNVYNGKLNLMVVFRSHDLIGGWINNVYALVYLLNDITESLKLQVGFLEVTSYDGHFYKNDWDKIDKIKSIMKV